MIFYYYKSIYKNIKYVSNYEIGGCSSDWLERQVVALGAAGSTPVTHH